MIILKPIETFFRNLRDSFRYSLKDIYRNTSHRKLDDDLLLEQILYIIPNNYIRRPKILTTDETLNEIITTNKNIARFGDGEFMIIEGNGIPYQKADKELSRRLRGIVTTPQDNLLIAINRRYYYPDVMREIIENKNEVSKSFELCAVPKLRRVFSKYINYDIEYGNAGLTYGFTGGDIFVVWREFFKDKKLVLVGCKEAFDSYQFNLFDIAKELVYEYTPNKHAFSKYDEILARLLKYDKEFIHILMCGPTSKVLVADLTKDGFRALDLGHLAKVYDWRKKGIDILDTNSQNTAKFYAPDESH